MKTDLEKVYEMVRRKFNAGQNIFRRPSVEILFRKIDELESRLTMRAVDVSPRCPKCNAIEGWHHPLCEDYIPESPRN